MGRVAGWGVLLAVVLSAGCHEGSVLVPRDPEPADEPPIVVSPATSPNVGAPPLQVVPPVRSCIDGDGDGYGVGSCLGPDCDDRDPLLGANGQRSCYSGPAHTAGVGICAAGVQQCVRGVLGPCQGEVLPSTEICDGLDNNCDGRVDENITRITQSGSTQPRVPIYRPVDILFVIDNSDSMTEEIRAVEQNINANFAALMEQSGLDYRVILISKFGDAAVDQSICIQAPLGGNLICDPGVSGCPVNGERFFHYSTEIGSRDSLFQIVQTYDQPDDCGLAPQGWSPWLRADATKIFIEITDDGPSGRNHRNPDGWSASFFQAQLEALSTTQFGTASAPNYVFHSIVGLHENMPPLAAWEPTDPLVNERCTGNGGNVVQAGLEYQKLSIATGGLRYPICEYQNFDAIFQSVANGIIAGSQLSCAITIQDIPAGSGMDGTTLEFMSTADGGIVPMKHVASAQDCSGDAFYTVDSQILLCPDACARWRSDSTANVEVLFACTPPRAP